MKIKCLFLGHKPYRPYTLRSANVITIQDEFGAYLCSINVCKNCGAVYSDLRSNQGRR